MSNAPTDKQGNYAIRQAGSADQQAGSGGSNGNVLHVRPHAGRSGCADDMATRLNSTGLSIDTCHDVYRALARACADQQAGSAVQQAGSAIQQAGSAVQQAGSAGSGKALRAMVLCMDVLGAAELEFFTVVARARPQLPIYIYGETAVGARLARAVESAVVSAVTDKLFDQLTDVDSSAQAIETRTEEIVTGTQVVDTPPPTIDTALEDRLNLVSAAPVAPDAPAEVKKPADSPKDLVEERDALSDEDEPSREDEDKPVQVPWLNRPDRPVRGKPVDRTPSRKPPEPDVAKKENAPLRGAHEPLLTNEELQALLGDDLGDTHGSGSSSPFDDGDRS